MIAEPSPLGWNWSVFRATTFARLLDQQTRRPTFQIATGDPAVNAASLMRK